MTDHKSVLQVFGPRHALSSRGLHVRESARSWKLVVPMAPELLEPVLALCARLAPPEAASVLGLIERYLRADLEPLHELQERDVASRVLTCC